MDRYKGSSLKYNCFASLPTSLLLLIFEYLDFKCRPLTIVKTIGLVSRSWNSIFGNDDTNFWCIVFSMFRLSIPYGMTRAKVDAALASPTSVASRGPRRVSLNSSKKLFFLTYVKKIKDKHDRHESLILFCREFLENNMSLRKDASIKLKKSISTYFPDIFDFDVNYRSTSMEGNTLLTLVCRGICKYKCIKLLVEEFHADVEVSDYAGMNPLIIAALSNNFKAVSYLLRCCNANINAYGAERQGNPMLTAEHWNVIKHGVTDTSKLLRSSRLKRLHEEMRGKFEIVYHSREVIRYVPRVVQVEVDIFDQRTCDLMAEVEHFDDWLIEKKRFFNELKCIRRGKDFSLALDKKQVTRDVAVEVVDMPNVDSSYGINSYMSGTHRNVLKSILASLQMNDNIVIRKPLGTLSDTVYQLMDFRTLDALLDSDMGFHDACKMVRSIFKDYTYFPSDEAQPAVIACRLDDVFDELVRSKLSELLPPITLQLNQSWLQSRKAYWDTIKHSSQTSKRSSYTSRAHLGKVNEYPPSRYHETLASMDNIIAAAVTQDVVTMVEVRAMQPIPFKVRAKVEANCVCGLQVHADDGVICVNEGCEIRLFHGECVGLSTRSSFLCPACSNATFVIPSNSKASMFAFRRNYTHSSNRPVTDNTRIV